MKPSCIEWYVFPVLKNYEQGPRLGSVFASNHRFAKLAAQCQWPEPIAVRSKLNCDEDADNLAALKRNGLEKTR